MNKLQKAIALGKAQKAKMDAESQTLKQKEQEANVKKYIDEVAWHNVILTRVSCFTLKLPKLSLEVKRNSRSKEEGQPLLTQSGHSRGFQPSITQAMITSTVTK